jgi:hypothetical protein
MAQPRGDSQLGFGPLEVPTSDSQAGALRTSEGERPTLPNGDGPSPAFPKQEALDRAYATCAALFDAAMTGANLRNQDVAYLLGVSESLVRKWRSAEARVCPNHVQLEQLPLSFKWHLFKAMSNRYGFARTALLRLVDSAGLLALGVDK